jgi:hypothetical protein
MTAKQIGSGKIASKFSCQLKHSQLERDIIKPAKALTLFYLIFF